MPVDDEDDTVAEDSGATTIDVLANDTDVDGDGLTITLVTQPDSGSVAVTNAGADLRYSPDDDYCNAGGPTTTSRTRFPTATGGMTPRTSR